MPRSPVLPRDERTFAAVALRAYFDGDLTAIDTVKVRQPGTALTQHVWQRLREQPPGATMTYRELLAEAPRAAGRACALNRVGVIVPCHRARRSDGGLGGYSWGLDRKRWLLDHERHRDAPGN